MFFLLWCSACLALHLKTQSALAEVSALGLASSSGGGALTRVAEELDVSRAELGRAREGRDALRARLGRAEEALAREEALDCGKAETRRSAEDALQRAKGESARQSREEVARLNAAAAAKVQALSLAPGDLQDRIARLASEKQSLLRDIAEAEGTLAVSRALVDASPAAVKQFAHRILTFGGEEETSKAKARPSAKHARASSAPARDAYSGPYVYNLQTAAAQNERVMLPQWRSQAVSMGVATKEVRQSIPFECQSPNAGGPDIHPFTSLSPSLSLSLIT